MFEAFEELCHLWCYAEDLESFETACKELINFYALVSSTKSAITHMGLNKNAAVRIHIPI